MRRPKRYYRDMTPEKAAELKAIYYTKPRTKTQAELGKLYGISQGSVSRIVSGQVWV